MSKTKSTVKTIVTLDHKTTAQEMDAIRLAIQSGGVDAGTITSLKRILATKSVATTSITIQKTRKTSSLASSRAKTATRGTKRTNNGDEADVSGPSSELISCTKSLVMSSLTTLSIEAEKAQKSVSSNDESKSPAKTSKVV